MAIQVMNGQSASVYGYSNARTKSMKTLLLGKETFRELTGCADANEIAAVLERTPYKEDLFTILDYSKDQLVEMALGRNLARTFTRVLHMAPAEGKHIVAALLRKWDVHNIKTILLAKHLKLSREEIEPFLVVAGGMQQADLDLLMQAKTVEEVVDSLSSTEYGRALTEKVGEYKKANDTTPLLQALETTHFEILNRAIRDADLTLRSLVKAEIDAKNVMLFARARQGQMEEKKAKELAIPGGSISREKLGQFLSGKSPTEAIKATFPGVFGKEAGDKIRSGSLTELEMALDNALAEKAISALRRSVLSVGAIAGYLYLKEQETANVRKILRAKEYQLAPQDMERMLVNLGM